MKENIADEILLKMNKRMESVSGLLAKQYKGVKPFDKQPMKSEDQLYWYDQLRDGWTYDENDTPVYDPRLDDMSYFIAKYGRGTVNEYIFEMETLKQRRSK